MQSFALDTPFIDFNSAPSKFTQEEAFVNDFSMKQYGNEWSFLETDHSSTSTDLIQGTPFQEAPFYKATLPKKTLRSESSVLRFCEALAREVLARLEDFEFNQRMTHCFTELVKKITSIVNCEITNQKYFNLYPLNALIALWKQRLEFILECLLNESRQFDYLDWLSIFSLEELPEELEKVTNQYAEVDSFMRFSDLASKEIFFNSYKKLLVTCNVIMTNSVILTKFLPDQRIRDEIPNIEDLALMSNEYWLFQHYNQATRKFALECCNKCKTCTSFTLPQDFLYRLKCSKGRFERLIQSYSALGIFASPSHNVEQLTQLFTFWTQVLWV